SKDTPVNASLNLTYSFGLVVTGYSHYIYFVNLSVAYNKEYPILIYVAIYKERHYIIYHMNRKAIYALGAGIIVVAIVILIIPRLSTPGSNVQEQQTNIQDS